MTVSAAAYGAAFGLFPIGWIVFWAIVLYRITVETGNFEVIKDSLGSLTADRRLQAILIAFSLSGFIEGAAGFGTRLRGHTELPKPLVDRLARNLEVTASGCWEWIGTRNPKGYGKLTLSGPKRPGLLVHRVAYEHLIGPIPAGLQLDHLCFNPPCFNPDHLEPVTNAENMRRQILAKEVV